MLLFFLTSLLAKMRFGNTLLCLVSMMQLHKSFFKLSSVVSQYYSPANCMITCLVANSTIPLFSCKSVPKTNTFSERNFAKLDQLLREKPNAITLSLEAMILCTNNQTASWLRAKPIEEVQEQMKKGLLNGPRI